MNWQPVVDALGTIVGFWLWPWLVALWAFAAIVQRYTVFDGYLRALGWDGVRELLASFGNSPASMVEVQRRAAEPVGMLPAPVETSLAIVAAPAERVPSLVPKPAER